MKLSSVKRLKKKDLNITSNITSNTNHLNIKNSNIIFKIIGYLLLIYWVLASIIHFYCDSWRSLFWLCNLLLLLVAYSLIKQNNKLLSAMLILSSVLQVPWIIDFLYFLIRGTFLFSKVANYIIYQPLIKNIFTLHHIFLPIILICYFLKNKFSVVFHSSSWKIASMITSVTFFISLFFTDNNINYVYSSNVWWFIIKLLGLTIIYYLLEQIILFFFKKKVKIL